MDLTTRLHAKRDCYARKLGRFVLTGSVVRIGSDREVWEFVRSIGGRIFRVLYRCQDGTVRDLIGRQGVHHSRQDGPVRGIGRAMADAELLTLSFWTNTLGSKVNTGTGKGYRTLRAAGILALRIDGIDYLTDEGIRSL